MWHYIQQHCLFFRNVYNVNDIAMTTSSPSSYNLHRHASQHDRKPLGDTAFSLTFHTGVLVAVSQLHLGIFAQATVPVLKDICQVGRSNSDFVYSIHSCTCRGLHSHTRSQSFLNADVRRHTETCTSKMYIYISNMCTHRHTTISSPIHSMKKH